MKINPFNLDTINKKLLLPTLLLVALLIGAVGSVLIVQQQHMLTSMMESKANSITTILAKISAQSLINFDSMTLRSFVKETVKDKDVAFAEFYEADGRSVTDECHESARRYLRVDGIREQYPGSRREAYWQDQGGVQD